MSDSPLRFVLIGGTGFLGAALARELRGRGLRVVTVARGSRTGSTRTAPDVRLDVVRTPEAIDRVIELGDTVIYLAGLSPLARPIGGRRRYRDVHVRGLAATLAAAEKQGAARFVGISALGVSATCAAAYGETKARAAAMVHASRIPGLVVEPSVLFGDGSEIIRALQLASRLAAVPLPRITAAIRPIHVADAARRLADAVTGSPLPERLELTGPELLTFEQVATAYLEPRGTRVILLPRSLSRTLTGLASRIKLPGVPAELDAMLAMDNAGKPPPRPHELIAYSDWAVRIGDDAPGVTSRRPDRDGVGSP